MLDLDFISTSDIFPGRNSTELWYLLLCHLYLQFTPSCILCLCWIFLRVIMYFSVAILMNCDTASKNSVWTVWWGIRTNAPVLAILFLYAMFPDPPVHLCHPWRNAPLCLFIRVRPSPSCQLVCEGRAPWTSGPCCGVCVGAAGVCCEVVWGPLLILSFSLICNLSCLSYFVFLPSYCFRCLSVARHGFRCTYFCFQLTFIFVNVPFDLTIFVISSFSFGI